MTVEISRIIIKIGDKEAELSLEQAKELKECLNELLGNEVKVEKEIVHVHDYPYHYHPYTTTWKYVKVEPDWTYVPNVYTYGNTSGTYTITVGDKSG